MAVFVDFFFSSAEKAERVAILVVGADNSSTLNQSMKELERQGRRIYGGQFKYKVEVVGGAEEMVSAVTQEQLDKVLSKYKGVKDEPGAEADGAERFRDSPQLTWVADRGPSAIGSQLLSELLLSQYSVCDVQSGTRSKMH